MVIAEGHLVIIIRTTKAVPTTLIIDRLRWAQNGRSVFSHVYGSFLLSFWNMYFCSFSIVLLSALLIHRCWFTYFSCCSLVSYMCYKYRRLWLVFSLSSWELLMNGSSQFSCIQTYAFPLWFKPFVSCSQKLWLKDLSIKMLFYILF